MHQGPDDGKCRGGTGAGPAETTIALDGDGTCIADARRLAASFLAQMQSRYGFAAVRRAADLTQLVVSELVTNARKYAPGPIRLRLRIADEAVEIAVWDNAPVMPAVRAADPERVGQHGLEIVKAITQKLTIQRESVGKRITALISLRPAQPHGSLAHPAR